MDLTLPPDFKEFLRLLKENNVRYLRAHESNHLGGPPVSDSAEATQFMQKLAELLESPVLMLV